MTIDPNANLAPGQQYTLSVLEGGVLGDIVGQSIDSVSAALNNSSAVDVATGISVSQSVLSIFTFDITFTYSGDGTDTPQDVFQEFAAALEATGYNWNYVTCTAGMQAGSAGATAVKTVAGAIQSVTPSSSSLWAVALIALLAIFVFSGGPELMRGLKG